MALKWLTRGFVGKDVAAALGYTDTAQGIRKHVDDEDKGVVDLTTPGGIQKVTIINESGLYSLVLSSKLPGAKQKSYKDFCRNLQVAIDKTNSLNYNSTV